MLQVEAQELTYAFGSKLALVRLMLAVISSSTVWSLLVR